MIGRLRGILVHEVPPWPKRRDRQALPRATLGARPGRAGRVLAGAMRSRHGRLRHGAAP